MVKLRKPINPLTEDMNRLEVTHDLDVSHVTNSMPTIHMLRLAVSLDHMFTHHSHVTCYQIQMTRSVY